MLCFDFPFRSIAQNMSLLVEQFFFFPHSTAEAPKTDENGAIEEGKRPRKKTTACLLPVQTVTTKMEQRHGHSQQRSKVGVQ